MVAAAIGGAAIAGVAGSAISAGAAGDAADSAASAQRDANASSIAEQRRQFDYVNQLLEPYRQSGTQALAQYQDLNGLNGAEAQQQAIGHLRDSQLYQNLMTSGKNALLQSVSATGGLRGGNTQGALAQLGNNTLQSIIQQQSGVLGGLANNGQNAAAQTGAFGAQAANAITGANTALGSGLSQTYGLQGQQTVNAINSGVGSIQGSLGTYAGLKAGGYF